MKMEDVKKHQKQIQMQKAIFQEKSNLILQTESKNEDGQTSMKKKTACIIIQKDRSYETLTFESSRDFREKWHNNRDLMKSQHLNLTKQTDEIKRKKKKEI